LPIWFISSTYSLIGITPVRQAAARLCQRNRQLADVCYGAVRHNYPV
jgi:hypothetical protein